MPRRRRVDAAAAAQAVHRADRPVCGRLRRRGAGVPAHAQHHLSRSEAGEPDGGRHGLRKAGMWTALGKILIHFLSIIRFI